MVNSDSCLVLPPHGSRQLLMHHVSHLHSSQQVKGRLRCSHLPPFKNTSWKSYMTVCSHPVPGWTASSPKIHVHPECDLIWKQGLSRCHLLSWDHTGLVWPQDEEKTDTQTDPQREHIVTTEAEWSDTSTSQGTPTIASSHHKLARGQERSP